MSSAILGLYDAQNASLLLGSPFFLETLAPMLAPEQRVKHTWYERNMLAAGDEAVQIWHQVLESRQALHIPEVHYKPEQDSEETIWDYTLTPILSAQKQGYVRYMLVSAIEITAFVRAKH